MESFRRCFGSFGVSDPSEGLVFNVFVSFLGIH